ncbi:unnamed protein product, partial [Mesorhabditis spiculigera]
MDEPSTSKEEDRPVDQECPICLARIGSKYSTLDGCKHIFHPLCIEQWIARTTNCPNCRAVVNKIYLKHNGKTVKEKTIEQKKVYDPVEEDFTACQVCGRNSDEDVLLLCDSCDQGFHTFCLPTPLSNVPDGSWYCPNCVRTMQSRNQQRRAQAVRAIPRTAAAERVRSRITDLVRELDELPLLSDEEEDELTDTDEEDEEDEEEVELPDDSEEEVTGPRFHRVDAAVLGSDDDDFGPLLSHQNLPKVERRRRKPKKAASTKTTKKGKVTRRKKRRRSGKKRHMRILDDFWGDNKKEAGGKQSPKKHRTFFEPARLSTTGAGYSSIVDGEHTDEYTRSALSRLFDQPLNRVTAKPKKPEPVKYVPPVDLLGDVIDEQTKLLAPGKYFRQEGDKLVATEDFKNYKESLNRKMSTSVAQALGLESTSKQRSPSESEDPKEKAARDRAYMEESRRNCIKALAERKERERNAKIFQKNEKRKAKMSREELLAEQRREAYGSSMPTYNPIKPSSSYGLPSYQQKTADNEGAVSSTSANGHHKHDREEGKKEHPKRHPKTASSSKPPNGDGDCNRDFYKKHTKDVEKHVMLVVKPAFKKKLISGAEYKQLLRDIVKPLLKERCLDPPTIVTKAKTQLEAFYAQKSR